MRSSSREMLLPVLLLLLLITDGSLVVGSSSCSGLMSRRSRSTASSFSFSSFSSFSSTLLSSLLLSCSSNFLAIRFEAPEELSAEPSLPLPPSPSTVEE